MHHPNPKAVVEQFVSFIERLDWHQLPGGWTELPVVGVFATRVRKIAKWPDFFNPATIQNGFAAASEGSS
jgi:limonene-1,2-epoxide hydrolase